MDRATEQWLKKYPPAIQERIKKLWAKQDRYMQDSSVPPMYGQTKSRLDVQDPELTIDMAKCDFLGACGTGDLPAAKHILERFKDEYVPSILNCTDDNGLSGLDYSVMYLYPKLEKYLLKMGATGTKNTAALRVEAAKVAAELKAGANRSALD